MTDKELLSLMKKDKTKGLTVLIDTYSALVYKVVSSVILPVGAVEDAEECVSDVFLAFYNNADKIDLAKGSVKGYLAVIGKRKAISLYRKLKKEKEGLADTGGIIPDIPEETGIDEETKKLLFDAVTALGEPDTTIIVRKYIFGETAKEISQYVGLSPEAVQKRIQRAAEKLKSMLGGVLYG